MFISCAVFATKHEHPTKELRTNKRDSWLYKSYVQIAPFFVSTLECSNNENKEKLFIPKPVETEFELVDIQWKQDPITAPNFIRASN